MIDTNIRQPDANTRWWLRISAVFWFIIVAAFLLSLPVLIEASWLSILMLVVVAALLAFPVAWIVRRLFARQRIQRPAVSYLKAFLGVAFVVGTLTAAPIFYLALLTTLRPMTVPQATLSNGQKTIVFQGMVHIGSEGFYKSVVYDLEKALADGYVLYYEGVRPSPEGDAWFSQTLAGGGDLSANYTLLSNVCGLRFQLDYFNFLGADMVARPERHVTADVTTADMMREYDRLVAADPAFAERVKAAAGQDDSNSADGLAQFVQWVDQATPTQKSLIGTICRGYFTWALTRESEPSPLDPVVLDFRNRELAKRLEAAPEQAIYVTYGAEHLHGVIDLLQASDPAWEVKSVKWTRTIEAPEELLGQL